ncbi:hypothetical protein [Nonlabens dokdonensis]|uniref:hypothetical protein n=1 Tax=Nonlabens dokdonensis TaxID=328515 RepID=UPI0026F0507F|nr:hypothetical protein [Nonlabens dokdonensis]
MQKYILFPSFPSAISLKIMDASLAFAKAEFSTSTLPHWVLHSMRYTIHSFII